MSKRCKVRFIESGTGETDALDIEANAYDRVALSKAIDDAIEGFNLTLMSYVRNGNEVAFIMTSMDDYFGPMVWAGIAYDVD